MQTYDVRAEFQGSYAALTAPVKYLVVHHAAALYPQQRGIDDVRAVRNWHVNGNNWPGIGYHWCIAEETQGGPLALYQCSSLDRARAHVYNQNHHSIAVSCLTNFDTHPSSLPTISWRNALTTALARLAVLYPQAEIVGHTEITVPGWGSSCPGKRWRDWKPDLLRAVQQQVAGDVFAAWGARGHPIKDHERTWPIAEAWRQRRDELGAALSGHSYIGEEPRLLVVRFERGFIWQAPGLPVRVEMYL